MDVYYMFSGFYYLLLSGFKRKVGQNGSKCDKMLDNLCELVGGGVNFPLQTL